MATELKSLNESVQSVFVSHSLYPTSADGKISIDLAGSSSLDIQMTSAKICEEFSKRGELEVITERGLEKLIRNIIKIKK